MTTKGFPNPAVPLGSLVAVTGVNGYVASHVADQLLAAGYGVRGTVRDSKKNAWIKDVFGKKYGDDKFELVEVKDMSVDGAYDEAAKGCGGFIHVASNMSWSADPNVVVTETVNAATNAVKSAAKEPNIKRFLYTSSSAATTLTHPNETRTIDENSWNEEAIKLAYGPNPEPYHVYCASKTQAERAIWKWVEDNKPGFVVNAVLPNANFGRAVSPTHQGQPSTSGWMVKLFYGDLEKARELDPQWFVDVVDVARLHVIALANPDVKGERIFGFAEPFNWNDILAILRMTFPQRKFIDDIEGIGRDLMTIVPAKRAEELLKEAYGKGWTSLEDSVRTTMVDFEA